LTAWQSVRILERRRAQRRAITGVRGSTACDTVPDEERSNIVVYAIVKAGGRQEKVAVGDILVVDRLSAGVGSTVELPALLLVDGTTVTHDAKALAKVSVTAEVVRDEKGPKIDILKYKNKTGYRKRQGHRQQLTRLKVTGIK